MISSVGKSERRSSFRELKLFNLGKLKEAKTIKELESMYHSGLP